MRKIYFILFALTLFTQLAAADFPWYSQGDDRWKKDQLGKSSRATIGRSGCVLSCLSMLLNAEATNPHVTPGELNTWLKQNGGYAGTNMKWQIPGQMDGNSNGLELVQQDNKRNNWKFLSEQLAKGNKVIVKVSGRRSHWVLVTKQVGPMDQASSYVINDPGMETYKERTLGHFGGFKAARSYSGNWLDEDAFSMDSDIQIVPVQSDEYLFYDLVNSPHPADVYVTIKNNLPVMIAGYFILGLFDKDNNFLRTISNEYVTIDSCQAYDLMYEMDDISSISQDSCTVNIIYSKYFSQMPTFDDTIPLSKNKEDDPMLNNSSIDEPDDLEKSIENDPEPGTD
jgi:hypothetical protein